MNEQELIELNKKLTLWVFPKAKFHTTEYGVEFIVSGKPYRTHAIDYKPLIRFTDSDYGIAYCFKWLMPKLEPLGYDLEIRNDAELLGWQICLRNRHSECSIASPCESAKSLDFIAQALCLAINRLIGVKV